MANRFAKTAMKTARRNALWVFTSAILAGLAANANAAQELTVYTTVLPNQIPAYSKSFQAANPDIAVKWVRDSTGVMAARVLAEGANSPADLIFSMASENVIQIDNAGLLLPYKPVAYDDINGRFKDKNDPPHWSGVFAYTAAICFNKTEALKRGIPVPTSWKDLLDPRYKGQLTMPDPSSSGTGFISVTGWLQAFGEKGAWDYMQALDQNLAMYTHSGNKPCNAAAAGEFVAGISYASEGVLEKARGAPLEIILPKEGIGWALSSVAILKSSKNIEAAKKFADWAISVEANKVYADFWDVIARPEFRKRSEHSSVDPLPLMADLDHYWVAEQRERVLKDWQSRFGSKKEPKR